MQDPEDTIYTRHVTNVEVRATTGYRPLSRLVTDTRFYVFDSDSSDIFPADHQRGPPP